MKLNNGSYHYLQAWTKITITLISQGLIALKSAYVKVYGKRILIKNCDQSPLHYPFSQSPTSQCPIRSVRNNHLFAMTQASENHLPNFSGFHVVGTISSFVPLRRVSSRCSEDGFWSFGKFSADLSRYSRMSLSSSLNISSSSSSCRSPVRKRLTYLSAHVKSISDYIKCVEPLYKGHLGTSPQASFDFLGG